ncbi:trehalose-phosphatase [Sphingomonas ursincola]|uniref:trehalose-phosphatase n=1 Tax=Sphingomonas ursincola TaxID=56361 RepID=UPI002352C181|nr:trehalose-phosphatase [Sphingomonas ursincola]MBY0621500.1 trehalose-phosphatase [Sphingomonas ursincola]
MPDSLVHLIVPAETHQEARPLALLLDFDGTLVEIGDTPDAVAISPAMANTLAEASRTLSGRIAVVSGRSLEQLNHLLPPALAGGVIAASHGQELSVDGAVQAPRPTRLFADLAFEAALHFEDFPGIVIEEKSFGLGVHYRLMPQLRDRAEQWAMAQAATHGLIVQQGDMVFELRPGGSDKGDAVRAIMALDRFAGSVPVFIGDDLTDIPAFEATRALGGQAISVGSRTADHSDERLDSVEGVRRRIAALIA